MADAHTVRSVAGQRALGPFWPKGEIETYTSAGLRSRNAS